MLFTLLFIMFLGMVISYLFEKNIINPIFSFNFIWMIMMLLYSLKLSYLQNDLTHTTMNVFLMAMLAFDFGYIFIRLINIKKKNEKLDVYKSMNVKISKKKIMKIFYLYVLIEILEIIYSRGVPLIWKFKGSQMTYAEFGIKSIHGLANSLGLIIIVFSFTYLKIINKKDSKMKFNIIFIIMLYVILMSRQVIISAFLEMFILNLLLNKAKGIKSKYYLYPIIIVIFLCAFGLLGNIRTGMDNFRSLAMMKITLPDFFSGFEWAYMYFTMGIANVNNIDLLGMNTNFDFNNLLNNFLQLIPTAFRNKFFGNNLIDSSQLLVTQAFNVSGYFYGFYIGSGIVGVFFISFFYGIVGAIIYSKYKKNKDVCQIISMSIYTHIIILSFFVNFMFSLPVIFQFVWIVVFKKVKVIEY